MRNFALGSLTTFVAITLFVISTFTAAWGTTETFLYSFDGASGAGPFGGLIADEAGNFYGTTAAGGMFGAGTVFELVRNGTSYSEVLLYSFTGGADGGSPVASLTRDTSGNLFGTTTRGGTFGAGTVFMLNADNFETVVYSFTGGTDGGFPVAAVVLDASERNLYGTTEHGGTGSCTDAHGSGCGVVFRVTTSGTETVLHRFSGHSDGALPMAPVVFDSTGATFYSTTYQGGIGTCMGPATGCGVAFKMTSTGVETVLHKFNAGAALPRAPLIFDNSGITLYGTASKGGNTICTGGCGAVFRLQTSGASFKVLHVFKSTDGSDPTGGLAFESTGNDLYGTTFLGGAHNLGVVFELTTSGTGYRDLHDFSGSPHDGANPFAGLLLNGPAKDVFPPTKGGCPPTCNGTTTSGGMDNLGTAFGLTN